MSIQQHGIKTNSRFNAVLIGAPNVGKSSLFTQYVDGTFSTNDYISNSKKIINVNGKFLELRLWDINERQQNYQQHKQMNTAQRVTRTTSSIDPGEQHNDFYSTDFDGIALVYDITNVISFETIRDWLHRFGSRHKNAVKIVVANKLDLLDEKMIDLIFAREYANELNISFIGVSAKNGLNVERMFSLLGEQMIQERQRQKEEILTRKLKEKMTKLVQKQRQVQDSNEVDNLDRKYQQANKQEYFQGKYQRPINSSLTTVDINNRRFPPNDTCPTCGVAHFFCAP
ncbi:unnamed protein product [Didymodactylos carnosus]|uniref:Uncharacterized protein n=1 Tax=Didymodactylos carnosus TaxID=1234261 RepID=A0A814LXB2_9BILA|nr:unnamed protein product [Didymodactylos carnosus]CAF1070927.1 unnamed protein product [Didymodactylos carnosus]CAF3522429.1 unnamed protein product [Didymodactylos carnosus]CAF3838013.1 unnamed protein product [Didymodactylos carnosus]